MKLGWRLQTLRQAAGWTQEQMAEQLSVTRQTISKWERDLSVPDALCLVKLRELFGISLDELLLGEGQEQGELFQQLERLARNNRRDRTRTVLAAAGAVAVVSGGLMLAFFKTLEHYLLSLHYMLYRYMTVGEYIRTPVSFRLPVALSAVVLAGGIVCLLWRVIRR